MSRKDDVEIAEEVQTTIPPSVVCIPTLATEPSNANLPQSSIPPQDDANSVIIIDDPSSIPLCRLRGGGSVRRSSRNRTPPPRPSFGSNIASSSRSVSPAPSSSKHDRASRKSKKKKKKKKNKESASRPSIGSTSSASVSSSKKSSKNFESASRPSI
eukprot:3351754-Ditylum_brightwellii.AAC.1